MRCLLLQTTIAVLCAVCIASVAALCLGLVHSVAITTLLNNGKKHTEAIGDGCYWRVVQFFELPAQHLSGSYLASNRIPEKFPSDSPSAQYPLPAALDKAADDLLVGTDTGRAVDAVFPGGFVTQRWTDTLVQQMVDSQWRFSGIFVWFTDGTMINIGHAVANRANSWSESTYRNLTTGKMNRRVDVFDRKSGKWQDPATDSTVQQDIDTRNMKAVSDPSHPGVQKVLDRIVPKQMDLEKMVPYYTSPRFFLKGDPQFYTLASTQMIDTSGTRYGWAGVLVGITDISRLLDEVPRTPNAAALLIDGKGHVTGASGDLKFFTMTDATFNETANKKWWTGGCTTTYLTRKTMPSVRDIIACRRHVSKLVDVLPALPDAFADARATGSTESGFVRRFETPDGAWLAWSRLIPDIALDFTVIVMMPESDIIGNVRQQLWIAVAGGIFGTILSAVIAAALIRVLLQPLTEVAEKMARAARLEEGAELNWRSRLGEVADLQQAYGDLASELTRIRAFVPQSLLRQGSESDDSADEEDDVQESSAMMRSGAEKSTSVAVHSRSGRLDASAAPPSDIGGTLSSIQRSVQHKSYRGTSISGSDASRDSRRRGPTRRALKTDSQLKSIGVSVLQANLRGFHRAAGSSLSLNNVDALVTLVLDVATAHRGVVDSLHGDRVTLSFNGARPCAGHCGWSAKAAADLADRVQSVGYRLPITAGVATGMAQVGNMGNSVMKRFTVVGPVVSQSAVLERLCKLYKGATCLVMQRSFEDLQVSVVLRTLDLVRLPFTRRPVLVGNIESLFLSKEDEKLDDEWMYQLERANKKSAATPGGVLDANDNASVIAATNGVWERISVGDVSGACSAAEAQQSIDVDSDAGAPWLSRHIGRLREALEDASAANADSVEHTPTMDCVLNAVCRKLGDMYDISFLDNHQ